MKLNKDLRKHFLGEMGSALIQQLLANQGIQSVPPWDVFHRSCDLLVYYDGIYRHPKQVQVKCKIPWAIEKSQSFTVEQWNYYKNCYRIYFICAPIQGKFKDIDEWKGNIYSASPSTISVRSKKTHAGREMILIPLEQSELKLEFVIKRKECLELMNELTTMEND